FGIAGVILITGPDALAGLGPAIAGQLACLTGAALYAGAALYGRRFTHLDAAVTATGTMICATVVLLPSALIIDRPWHLEPTPEATIAALLLAVLSTALALILYFRLISTIGPLGTASQSYLRAGIGVALGMLILDESLSLVTSAGIAAAILGVVLINGPKRR
ncbi:MAG: EamA family transporter, partial [Albidovulum sp.]|uniref:EamA family transporter n=1 Tax=Albidovulum sp. TaxID=1872424 RepID=UPI003CA738E8